MSGKYSFSRNDVSNTALDVGGGGPAYPSGLLAYNPSASTVYVKLKNAPASAAVVATKAEGDFFFSLAAGQRAALDVLPNFRKGLSIAATTGWSNSTAPSSALEVSMVY